jgi:uncharacterized membrane protein (GlpM family)
MHIKIKFEELFFALWAIRLFFIYLLTGYYFFRVTKGYHFSLNKKIYVYSLEINKKGKIKRTKKEKRKEEK